MKHFLLTISILFALASCKSEAAKEQEKDVQKETEVEEIVEKDTITIFQSTDLNATEYLKLVEPKNGTREWYYWTDKNEEEIRLGVKTIDGLEAIYFYGKPNELYEIGGSECGFSLFLGEERLQWYDQIKPNCNVSNYN